MITDDQRGRLDGLITAWEIVLHEAHALLDSGQEGFAKPMLKVSSMIHERINAELQPRIVVDVSPTAL